MKYEHTRFGPFTCLYKEFRRFFTLSWLTSGRTFFSSSYSFVILKRSSSSWCWDLLADVKAPLSFVGAGLSR